MAELTNGRHFSSDIVSKMKLLDDARETLQHFSLTDWKFPSDNFDQIHQLMSDGDRQLFPTDVNDKTREEHLIELRHSLVAGWMCLKKYKLKEDINDGERARKRQNM